MNNKIQTLCKIFIIIYNSIFTVIYYILTHNSVNRKSNWFETNHFSLNVVDCSTVVSLFTLFSWCRRVVSTPKWFSWHLPWELSASLVFSCSSIKHQTTSSCRHCTHFIFEPTSCHYPEYWWDSVFVGSRSSIR